MKIYFDHQKRLNTFHIKTKNRNKKNYERFINDINQNIKPMAQKEIYNPRIFSCGWKKTIKIQHVLIQEKCKIYVNLFLFRIWIHTIFIHISLYFHYIVCFLCFALGKFFHEIEFLSSMSNNSFTKVAYGTHKRVLNKS